VPAAGPVALHLKALAAPNAAPLAAPLHWTVTHEGDANAVVYDAQAANPVVPVAPGRYMVAVRGELVSASQSVTVHENRPMAVPIALGAGALRVRVAAQKTNAPLADAIVTIATPGGAPLAVFKAGEASAMLPAGEFRVSAELGLVRAEQAATVAPGRSTAVDIVLDVGRLQLTTAPRDGLAPLEAALFMVMEDDPPRGRREVARSAASQAEFALPPGTYYVVARQGSVEARERLELGSGDVVKRTLSAATGRLGLTTVPPAEAAATGSLVSYTIRRIDGPGQDAISTSQPSPVLFLPAGRYRVEGRYGLANVTTAMDVEIKAGQTVQLAIEHRAATLQLRFVGAGSGAPGDVAWEVRDEAGRMVWSAGRAEARGLLQPGRYVVTASTRALREKRTVELHAGEPTLVEIRAE
jgi:Ca-activated chloride channel family protein